MTTKKTVQESPEKEYGLLSLEEQALFTQISTMEAPYSLRAQAILALGKGETQTEACRQSGLSQGQVRYWLAKFRRDGMGIFPQELLNQAQTAAQVGASESEELDLSQDQGDAQPAQAAEKSGSKKKTKKKSKKKSKKTKKSKKEKKPKKKPNKKKSSKKAGGKKGKPGKKKQKNK